MPEKSNDYRNLIEERFSNIITLMNAQFTTVHDRLDRIETQTTKTNGRVDQLEKSDNKFKIENAARATSCPHVDKITKIDENLMEYKMVKRYPKIMIAILVLYGLITIATTLKVFM